MSSANEPVARPKHGAICWNELNVHDVERAKKFYSESLGWSFEGMPMGGFTYWIISSHGARVGGMFEMKGPEFEGVPEHWLTYIGVDDVDARVGKAKAAGATICKDAFDIPGVGRMAVLQEPGGAIVAWMTPRPQQNA
ncbi:VOC family protein [Methylocystis sp. B8]|uniref:VOC family protein n=1 Tax=Methylocystis sp. B8 TaxID=544938 RepID=UPI0010FF6195|nr:VOC family protein [Methylocystis sp. B8]TLG75594.1 VOC family protein [Methylocystis sp. B8]